MSSHSDTLDHADIHVQAAALEDLHTLASDRDVVRALVDAVLARDPYHWGTLHAGKEASIGLRYDHVIAATGEQVLSDIVSKQGDVTVAHVGTRHDAKSGLIASQ